MRTAFISLLLLLSLSVFADKKTFTLVIDAGHGGHDPGAVGKSAKEKNINLATALAFGRLVEANCPQVKVVYTRKTDVFVPLHQRANIANRNKADLFVSIHTNALPKGKVTRGAETYTLGMARANANLEVAKRENSVILIESDYKTRYEGFDPNSSESYIIFEMLQDNNMAKSVQLANGIQKQFGAAGRTDKGVHQAGFLLLRETTMPSVLVELGYITTRDEEQFLASSDGSGSMGRAIYNAFLSYYNSHQGEEAVTQPNVPQQPAVQPAANPTVQPSASTSPVLAQAEVQQKPSEDWKSSPLIEDVVDVSIMEERKAAMQEASEVEFRVQFMTYPSALPATSLPADLAELAFYVDNNMYKYTTGRFTEYAEAQRYRNEVARRYEGAFVVAFRNGMRIDIREARKKTK